MSEFPRLEAGPRVDDDPSVGWPWLTWETAVNPSMIRYDQRRLTRVEAVLWRAFRRAPRKLEHG